MVEIQKMYRLTPLQEGMLFHFLLNEDTSQYYEQFHFRINGPVNITFFEQSLNEIMKRHDVLRTVFVYEDLEDPLQIVLKERQASFNYINISHLPEKEQERFVEQFKEQHKNEGFHISEDVLIKLALIQIKPDSFHMIWSFHHIIMDGWCLGIVMNDFIAFYRSLENGKEPKLGSPFPFSDYIRWLDEQDAEAAEQYWEAYLQGYQQLASLPQKSQQQTDAYDHREAILSFDEKMTQELLQIAERYHVTVNTIFQTAWALLLARYNQADDVVFGAVVSGRQADVTGIENMVGLFINTIPVRVQFKDNMSFSELLQQVQESALSSTAYDYLSLATVQRVSTLKNNLLNHVIAFENYPLQDQLSETNDNAGLDFSIETVTIFEKTNYDINIIVTMGTSLAVKFVYNAAVYDEKMIENMTTHLKSIFSSIAKWPDMKLQHIDMLTEAEKARILVDFNDTEAAYPEAKTIHGLFEEQVEKTPEQVAAVFGEERLTYRELNERAEQLARALRQLGVQPDDLVGLLTERSLDMMVGILGILKAGGAYVPLDPDYPEERIRYMLEDCGTKLLVTQKKLAELAGIFAGTILYVEDELVDELGAVSTANPVKVEMVAEERNVRADHLAYVIYTSGTTGKPKGVLIEHRQVVRLLFTDRSRFDFGDTDVWTLFHSYCFDFSVWEMYGALLYGGKLVIIPKQTAQDPAAYLQVLKQEQVTIVNQTPTAFYHLADEELRCTDKRLSVRKVIFGGEALEPLQLKRFREKYPETQLINMYGITETTVHVTYKELTEDDLGLSKSNIGSPIPTLTAYVLDAARQPVPIGIPGELYVGGAGVARGYLNRPELTADRFVDHPFIVGERVYRTGDLARWMPDGNLEYLGRIDHQVKIRGYRIELGEIETQLLRHEQVKETIVLARKSPAGDPYLCAYVVVTGEYGELDVAELRRYLGQHLPSYMIPSFFVALERMPLTSNGKIDRQALPSPEGHAVTGVEYVAPRTEQEAQLAEVWQRVLGLDRVGVRDNFFDIGGDSIKGIRLVVAINQSLDIQMHMIDLYKHPDISSLVDHIGRLESDISSQAWTEAQEGVERLKQQLMEQGELFSESEIEDIYPMSDIQQGMVYYSMAHPDDAVYHDQFIYQIRETDFEPNVLNRALDLLVQKHSILRCSFHLQQAPGWVQAVHKEVELPVELFDLRDRSRRQQEQFIREQMEADRNRPFLLDQAPLWRIKVCMLSDSQLALCFIFHHAILDGWSVASFITELMNVYVRLKEERSFTPEPLANSYKAYIVDQIALKKEEDIIEYWRSELDGYKRLQLPDVTLAGASSGRSERVRIHHPVNRELFERLQELARKHDTSVKTVCFAAYINMLRMITYESDIVVGIVENNRPLCEDGDRMLGCFLNTVPFRLVMDERATWNTIIGDVKRKLQDLKKHGRLPLFDIVKAIGENPSGQNPIFDVLFNFVDFHVYNSEEQKERFAPDAEQLLDVGAYENTNTLFDFSISTTFGQMDVLVNCQSSAFPEEWAQRLIGYYFNILQDMVELPDNSIDKGRLLAAEERKRLLIGFNNTEAVYPRGKTIHELFAEQAKKTPNQAAVVCKEQYLTYRELDEQADRLARVLKERDVRPDGIVGLMAESSLEIVVGILGVLKAGGAYLPIDPEYPEERIRYMLEDSGASMLLIQPHLKERMYDWISQPSGLAKSNSYQLLELSLERSNKNEWYGREGEREAAAAGISLEPSESTAGPHHLAYVIYTSGSTGKPKGVMVEHQSLVNLSVWHQQFYEVTEADRSAKYASWAFDASVWELFPYLISGATVHILPEELRLDIRALNDYYHGNDITIAWLPPQMYEQLSELENDSLRLLLTGSDKVKGYKLVNYEVWNTYGPTESTVICTAYRIEGEETNIPIGKPLTNTRMYVLDEYMQLQPIGAPGELFIAGEGLARGYLNRPELTVEKFVDDPFVPGERMYRTGDLGRWLPDGNLEYLGRIDQQVKIRGYRIEIGEIETALQREGIVKEAVVIARQDEHGVPFLCAYVVATEELDEAELRRVLGQQLPSYMIPAFFVQLESMPLTPNGKVDKKQLFNTELDKTRYKNTEYAKPETDVEKIVVAIWEEVLGVKEIGIRDDFFQLGGDSIKAIQVASRLHNHNYKLAINDLFYHPTIEQVSPYIEIMERQIDQGSVEGVVELVPIQKMFLEQETNAPHHFNQSVMLFAKQGFSEDGIRKAFTKIVEHHDALRMVYKYEDAEYKQFNRSLNGELFHLTVSDLLHCNDAAALAERIEQEANRIQESIDLQVGPLVKLGLFKTSAGDHLLIVIHHLIIDGVSWRIILEDLATAYAQTMQHKPIQLPRKTDSFQRWAEHLTYYANDSAIQEELSYWVELETITTSPLPKDYDYGEIQLRELDYVAVELSRDNTDKLLRHIHHAYNTEVKDILLAALSLSLYEWGLQEQVVVNLEGHGREELIKDIDITRTVGWFTACYPVKLHAYPNKDLGYQLKATKESLRNIPNNGIGYGVIKYLTSKKNKNDVELSLQPDINFNYLGQFGQGKEDSEFQTSPFSTGRSLSPDSKAHYVIDMNGMIADGTFSLTIGYSTKHYQRDTVKRLGEIYENVLINVIHHCEEKKDTEFTPSDLVTADLSIEELEELNEEIATLLDLDEELT
ncbi:amino acid adenylation domain-containing protein [Paenibacillus alvei TS-15]|uniref:Amino acid adenylation domain-containing protein n=1 Tax=Paenibacillus alvei TS-15 TaxID=1117108 RepID=S9SLF1_PAEAL|nr:non-ribosomal peptide synthetase [Paenibacillus alvei]EPY04933.1 amino acid adenylation domain-containing protein [Paenibacillus alvei TS-15]